VLVFLNIENSQHLRGFTIYDAAMNRSILRNSLAVALCAGVITLAAVAPNALVSHRAPVADSILDTSVALIGTLIALLEFGRYRRSGNADALLIAIAVILFAWVHSLFDLVPTLLVPHLMSGEVGHRVEVWGTGITRVLAGWYLLWASICGTQKARPLKAWHHVKYEVVAPGVLGVGAVALLVSLVPPAHTGLFQNFLWPQSMSELLPLLGAPIFTVAGWRLSEQSDERSDEFQGWFATGCIFAGFSMISSALLPVHGIFWVRPSDLLREAAVGAWAWGAVAEIRLYWSTIAESARREALRSAALDLHDGLAQELALLSSFMYAPPEQRAEPEWHEQLQSTAERALAEARRTIATLAGDQSLPIEVDLVRTVDAFSKDVDVRVEVDLSSVSAVSDPSRRESIVRIVREAVTNAVRHGKAGHVIVRISMEDGFATLQVSDDGIGFDDTAAADSGRFGLVSMRERAEEIGASLEVHSEPGLGTTVEVLWP
jgi:signal transduction histidine kinase